MVQFVHFSLKIQYPDHRTVITHMLDFVKNAFTVFISWVYTNIPQEDILVYRATDVSR